MRVLREGKPQKNEEPIYVGTCDKCGCIIECSHADVMWRRSWNVRSEAPPWQVVSCPTTGCRSDIKVDLKPGVREFSKPQKYAKNQVWKSFDRLLCQIYEDGTVTFVNDITEAELRWAVESLLKQRELERQRRLEDWDRGLRELALGDMVYLSEEMKLYDNRGA